MSITLSDKDSILKRLYDDNEEVWAEAQADAIELIEKQADRITELEDYVKAAYEWFGLFCVHAPFMFGGEAEMGEQAQELLMGGSHEPSI